MGKKSKGTRSFRDGWEAAGGGIARNGNPYPSSAQIDRDDWFRGYDAYLDGFAVGRRRLVTIPSQAHK
jgi:hypothetical protein